MDDLHGMTNDDLHEALRPARGILYGAGVSILGWIALVAIVAACAGCAPKSYRSSSTPKNPMVYEHDDRTGLCFVAIYEFYSSNYFIEVECTPEVLALVNE